MLVVHRAGSGAVLARTLAELLATPGRNPFAPEVVAVPAKGVERWLAQRLSHHLGTGDGDGVCANVAFPSPARLLDAALQATGPDSTDAVERWSPGVATWSLLEVLESCAVDDGWCAPISAHVGPRAGDGSGSDVGGGRVQVARRLARLFDSYAHARPQMLLAWADGRDESGAGQALAGDLVWQAELWRRLRAHIALPSPAELLAPATARLRVEPEVVDLPERFSVFGASRISPARLTVLQALAEHRDVHLWLHHPSPALWERARSVPAPRRRADDPTRATLRHPLLSSLSRDVLELQHLLQTSAPELRDLLHEQPVGPPTTLLERLGYDLATDSLPTERAPVRPDDRSVQVHACHGRTRQVEVLREAILGLLADDPRLEPRDVLVMTPDVELFAPLIAASFALGGEEGVSPHPAAGLRVRLADRALRRTNPLLGVLSRLLDLGTARITATQVLDLAGDSAVRRRFGFADEDLERLRSWAAAAHIRWGLDAEHRSTWQVRLEQGTWREGIDRLLLGAALEQDQPDVGGRIPVDDVDSADIALVGRVAELVDRLAAAQELMSGRHRAGEWMTGLEAAVLSLGQAAPDAGWQELQLHTELTDIATAAAGSATLIELADVRAVLAEVLAARPTRASFRTGSLTVCTLVPMRSVPHKVVCLLGLDDGVFPRQTVREGDDVLARDPWIGERDPRSEDRQLLLDAIGAAEQHLVVTYTGADERTGAPVPPAVPLGELLDALDRTACSSDGRPVSELVTTHHPLQPFDTRNFTAGALSRSGPFSFDPLGYAGARAVTAARRPEPAFLEMPLPMPGPADVELADLIALLAHPARGFLRQRLGVALTREEEDPDDELPVALAGLARWDVGERMLQDRLSGRPPAECKARELQRGTLPPGPLGEREASAIGRQVEAIVLDTEAERQQEPRPVDVDVILGDGTRVAGTVAGVRGEVLLATRYSSLGARHRLQAWVELVALTVSGPGTGWRAVTVGKAREGSERRVVGPIGTDVARTTLEGLVALHRSGLRTPLPLPVKTAAAYAERRHRGSTPAIALAMAEDQWVEGTFPGERADGAHALVWGPDAPFRVLLDRRPLPEDPGPAGPWPEDETSRFGRLACALWWPALDAELASRR